MSYVGITICRDCCICCIMLQSFKRHLSKSIRIPYEEWALDERLTWIRIRDESSSVKLVQIWSARLRIFIWGYSLGCGLAEHRSRSNVTKLKFYALESMVSREPNEFCLNRCLEFKSGISLPSLFKDRRFAFWRSSFRFLNIVVSLVRTWTLSLVLLYF